MSNSYRKCEYNSYNNGSVSFPAMCVLGGGGGGGGGTSKGIPFVLHLILSKQQLHF